MRKQSNTSSTNNIKSRKAENTGKGKVTPVQIAFIVDRYLSDNNYYQTRSTFRSEASNLICKSPVLEAPKTLLSLGTMLDEYIRLKELKVSMEQERCRMEQENLRVNTLLKGMQDAMNVFNATSQAVTPSPPPPSLPPPPQSGIVPPNIELPIVGSPPGYYSAYSSPAVVSTSRSSTTRGDTSSISCQITNHTDSERKRPKLSSDASITAKKSRRSSTTNQLPPKDTNKHSVPNTRDDHQVVSQNHTAAESLPLANVSGESLVHGSTAVQSSHVVKCLFNQPVQSPPIISSGPKTPPLASSPPAEKSASPFEICSTATANKDVTPQQITSTNCTIISSETIRVSPAKQISYYSIARNQQISTFSPSKANFKKPNKRDHVKGRLDFDASDMHTASGKPLSNEISTSECLKEGDILDLDLPSLDALADINLSELLVDFDLADEGTCYSSQSAVDSSPDSISWSPQKSVKVNIGANQVFSQLSSTVTEILSEDTTLTGQDSLTTVKSVTKTIKILSPAKTHRSGLDH